MINLLEVEKEKLNEQQATTQHIANLSILETSRLRTYAIDMEKLYKKEKFKNKMLRFFGISFGVVAFVAGILVGTL